MKPRSSHNDELIQRDKNKRENVYEYRKEMGRLQQTIEKEKRREKQARGIVVLSLWIVVLFLLVLCLAERVIEMYNIPRPIPALFALAVLLLTVLHHLFRYKMVKQIQKRLVELDKQLRE